MLLFALWLVVSLLFGRLISLYIQAKFMQAPVTLREFVRMRLKGVDQPTVVISYIRLVKSGRTGITVQDLIDHYLAGGRVPMVTNALISASRTNTDLDWEEACIADLEGRDIFEETQEKVAAILAAEQ